MNSQNNQKNQNSHNNQNNQKSQNNKSNQNKHQLNLMMIYKHQLIMNNRINKLILIYLKSLIMNLMIKRKINLKIKIMIQNHQQKEIIKIHRMKERTKIKIKMNLIKMNNQIIKMFHLLMMFHKIMNQKYQMIKKMIKSLMMLKM